MTPALRCTRRAFMLLVAAGAGGCNQRAIESWLSQTDGPEATGSLYGEAQYTRAMAEIRKRVPSPIQALSLLIYPDHAVLQAQDPAAPKNVLQYVYRGGAISPPVPVKLLGTGKLEDNLFSLESVKTVALPRLVRDAKARANIPEGLVSRVLLKRDLPDTLDVRFRIFVTSQRRDASFQADQTGQLID